LRQRGVIDKGVYITNVTPPTNMMIIVAVVVVVNECR
jgi:hypothetical protein